MVLIYNLDGYVADVDVNSQLGIDLSGVTHTRGGAVTLTTDQLWMTDVGKLAGRPLATFEGVVDPLNWDNCTATKSFFVRMHEVPPTTPWPKTIDETVRLYPGTANPNVTARLRYDYSVSAIVVRCTFDLDPAYRGEIVVDKGWVKATTLTANVTDASGASDDVTFFRLTSSKSIKFADGRQLPDPILAMFWGWAATKLVDCAGPVASP